ncbi:MAG: hypothetical protein WCB27_15275 [Thermoguttaceae bacterium]
MQLVLGAPSKFHLKVTEPDGKPVAGATILVSALGMKAEHHQIGPGEIVFPPDVLVDRGKARTDEYGIAEIPAWCPADVLRVDVITPKFGRQSCFSRRFVGERPNDWTIKLMPVGKLRGRVVADGPHPVAGLTVRLKAMSAPDDRSYAMPRFIKEPPIFMSAEAVATTDPRGRFEVPATPYGWVNFDVSDGLNRPYQYLDPDDWRGERRPKFRQEIRPS